MSEVLNTLTALRVAVSGIHINRILHESPGAAAESPTLEDQALLDDHPESHLIRMMAVIIDEKGLHDALTQVFLTAMMANISISLGDETLSEANATALRALEEQLDEPGVRRRSDAGHKAWQKFTAGNQGDRP